MPKTLQSAELLFEGKGKQGIKKTESTGVYIGKEKNTKNTENTLKVLIL